MVINSIKDNKKIHLLGKTVHEPKPDNVFRLEPYLPYYCKTFHFGCSIEFWICLCQTVLLSLRIIIYLFISLVHFSSALVPWRVKIRGHMLTYETILYNVNHMSAYGPVSTLEIHTPAYGDTFGNVNHMSTCEVIMRNIKHRLTYGVIMCNMNHMLIFEVIFVNMNHMWTCETVLRIMKQYVDIWNHIVHYQVICLHMKESSTL